MYGLICYNDDGYLQITDEYKSFVYLGKGSVNLSGSIWEPATDTRVGSNAQISLPNTFGFPPILAFRSDTRVAIYRTRLVGGNWLFDITSEQGTRTNTVFWYAFGPCPNVLTDPYGLSVSNAAGELTYHTGYRPLIVRDFKSGPDNTSLPETFDIGSGRTLAVAIVSTLWSWTPQQPIGGWQQFLLSTTIVTPNGYQANIEQTIIGSTFRANNFGFGGGVSGRWAVLAIDVTGL